ncbi:lipopolysaccharide biosynthesis protein [Roseateles sp. NT4]|uniref:lipopolysaccharide biosynthesis protein n=1 Tax=Roseateles sp. NT4 TaxID=3453715 RepID=UPI003EEA61DB
MRLFSSSIWNAATSLLITAVSFASGVILARALGAEGRGTYAVVILVVTLASGLAQLGLGQSFVYTSRQQGHGARRWLAVASMVSVGVLAALLAAGMGTTLGEKLSKVLILSMLGLSLLQAAVTYSSNAIQITADVRDFNAVRLVPAVAGLGAVAALAFTHHLNVETAIWAAIGAATLAIAAGAGLLLAGPRSAPLYASGSLGAGWIKSYVGYGIRYHGTIVLGILVQNLDKVALTYLGSPREFGVYTVAYNTSRFIGVFQESISAALYSRFAGMPSAELGSATRTAFELSFAPVLLLAVVMGSAGFWLMPAIYGADFSSASLIFFILVIECVIGGSSWLLAQRFSADGRPGLIFLRQMVSLVPVILALFFVSHRNFAVILAASMLVSSILRLVLTFVIYKVVFHEGIPKLFVGPGRYKRQIGMK